MKSTFRILFFARWESAKDNGKVPLQARITLDGDKAKFSLKTEVTALPETDRSGYGLDRNLCFTMARNALPALSSMPAGVDGAYVQIDGR